MSKLVLFLLLLGGILFWWHWKNTPDAKQKKALLQKTVIGVLVMGLLLLVVTGRVHWVGAVFAGLLATFRQLLPFIVRYLPTFTQLYRNYAPRSKPPNSSTVSSKIIEMTLDHSSGNLSGRVLNGDFKGSQLDNLSQDELQTLYNYCVQTDMDSAKLLESYITERFGGEEKYYTDSGGQQSNYQSDSMSVSEALQVLGIEGDPGVEDITNAYRKVMQKLHPDRGGNEYFAAKANQAREVLLNKYS